MPNVLARIYRQIIFTDSDSTAKRSERPLSGRLYYVNYISLTDPCLSLVVGLHLRGRCSQASFVMLGALAGNSPLTLFGGKSFEAAIRVDDDDSLNGRRCQILKIGNSALLPIGGCRRSVFLRLGFHVRVFGRCRGFRGKQIGHFRSNHFRDIVRAIHRLVGEQHPVGGAPRPTEQPVTELR